METQTLYKLPTALHGSDGHHETTLPKDNTYYRSRLFTSQSGPNLLIASAQPLLVLISRLFNASELHDLQTLHSLLPHEFKAFTARARGFNYSDEIISLAHHLLRTALDDILEQLNPSTLQQNEQDDKFFHVVHQICHKASSHVDLIELAYVILCVGYTGNYRFQPNGKMELENLLENLHLILREHRGDKHPSLIASFLPRENKNKTSTSIHLGWLTGVAISIVLSLAVGFNYVLNSVSHSMLIQFK